MLIERQVTVKSKVTPSLRNFLGAKTQKSVRDVEERIGKLAPGSGERAALQAERERLLGQLKEIANLKDGQEVTRGQVRGLYEVKIGDVWDEVQSADVILEDGRVVAMRSGRDVTVAIPDEDRIHP